MGYHCIMGGLYLLVMRLDGKASIAAGALGALNYESGWYVYTGSARAGLEQRLARHARVEKKFHWHIDYFLERAVLVRTKSFALPDAASEALLRARLLDVVQKSRNVSTEKFCADRLRTECLLAAAVGSLRGAAVAAPRFGASDCRCPSHLFYFKREPSVLF